MSNFQHWRDLLCSHLTEVSTGIPKGAGPITSVRIWATPGKLSLIKEAIPEQHVFWSITGHFSFSKSDKIGSYCYDALSIKILESKYLYDPESYCLELLGKGAPETVLAYKYYPDYPAPQILHKNPKALWAF